jgi:elongation factor 2
MEEGMVPKEEKKLIKYLIEKYDFEDDAKIWSVGDEQNKVNMLVNCTKGVDGINDVKDMIVCAFIECIKKGVICEENLRGVRYNITDIKIHSDNSHRGSGQIMNMAKRAFKASQLLANPRLFEPIFMVDISVDDKNIGNVYDVLNKKGGNIIGTEKGLIKAYLPVRKSFKLTSDLRGKTSGKAFTQCNFDHWNIIDDDPLEEESNIRSEIISIRKRKNLNESDIPPLDRFLDKL